MLKMATVKYCCNGGNAVMVEPLWPMKRRGTKYFMALYQCKKCKEYTLRGDSQAKEWNTFVEILNKQTAQELIQRKKEKYQK